MNTLWRAVALVALSVCLLFPLTLSAQERPVEFGIDGGISVFMPDGDDAENLTIVGFPNNSAFGVTAIRFGFFVSPRVAIEPRLAVTRSSDGDCSSALLDLFPSVLYHFKDFDRISLPYVRAGAGLSHSRWDCGDDNDSDTQFGFGGGVGLKIPMAETAFIRLEAAYEKWLEQGDEGNWDEFVRGYSALRLSIGISAILN